MSIGISVSCGTCGSKRCGCVAREMSSTKYSGLNKVFTDTIGKITGTGKSTPFFTFGNRNCPTIGEPDSFDFKVLESYTEGGLTLAKVLYPPCTNYEGKKILLLRMEKEDLDSLDCLDPHFLECGENRLLARFVPTRGGWEMGLTLLKSLL